MAEGERTVEDRLREEYFQLLPDVRRLTGHLVSQINYHLLPILSSLESYEQLVVRSRIKECESAVDALRRREEGATFDRERPDRYSLANLNDLAAVRILVFPRKRIRQVDDALRKIFPAWTSDPVTIDEEVQGLKYHGYSRTSQRIRGEYQIVSMLVGLFWDVEHSALYKPLPQLKGVALPRMMRQRRREVFHVLEAFEDEFERMIDGATPAH